MWSSAALLLEYDRNNWFTKTLAYMFMLKTTAVFGGIFSSLKEYVSAGSHPLQHTGGYISTFCLGPKLPEDICMSKKKYGKLFLQY